MRGATGSAWRRLLAALGVTAALLLVPVTALAGRGEAETGSMSIDVDEGQALYLSRPASHVFIANPDIADVQAPQQRTVLVLGKKPGRTTLIALDGKGEEITRIAITVATGLGMLRERLGRDYPGLEVTVDGTPNGILVAGHVETPEQGHGVIDLVKAYVPDSAKVVDRLHVDSQIQVQLRVHVAEMSRQVVNQFGLNWQAIIKMGSNVGGLLTGRNAINLTSSTNSSGSSSSSTAIPLGGPIQTVTPNTSTNTAVGGVTAGVATIDAVLDLLGQDGLATILAEPTLTAISGQTATFLAGGEIPVVTQSGLNGTNVTYKEYGIRLNFTPTVMSHDRISLAVRPELSQLTTVGSVTTDGITIPALSTRRVDTAVELGSGDSFVIGGLLENDRNNSNSRLPGLGDIPVLGKLFQSQSFQNNESELVVMVTPYIVQPTKPNAVATAERPFRAVTEAERLMMGPAAEGTPPQPDARLYGQAGFAF